MKILILSCHTGDGHNRAAQAIAKELDLMGIDWEIRDPVGFQSERAKKVVSLMYNDMIKFSPRSFGKIYKLGRWYSEKKLPSPVYLANAHYAPLLHNYIERENIDAVICTHLYGMEAMTAILQRYGNIVPTFAVLTDYTLIPFMRDIELDGYFIPHKSLIPQLKKMGICDSQIFCTGIPVDNSFNSDITKEEARKKLGLPMDKKIIMIMTGGVGCNNGENICDAFYNNTDDSFYACFFAGRNEELRKRIELSYSSKILALGFTNEVPTYMKACDVLITKAGGLSSTEAAVANIPLVHIYPIPGCETENAKFFMECGMSLWARDTEDAIEKSYILSENLVCSEQMKVAQRREINPNSAMDLAKKVVEYVPMR